MANASPSSARSVLMAGSRYTCGYIHQTTPTKPHPLFQMALQLAYYRLHHKFVLTYESATTRLYYEGRTETIRPMSTHSVAFVKAMDDPNCSKEDIKKLLKQAVE